MKKIVLALAAASFLLSCEISGGNKGVVKRLDESETGATFNDTKPEEKAEDTVTHEAESHADSTAVKASH